MERFLCNFDNLRNKERLQRRIALLQGSWRVTISRLRASRTLAQNRWYWGAIVAALAEYLTDQDYDVTTKEQAHELLKARFLTVDVTNQLTGEVIGTRVRSTTELDTVGFAEYCERCRAWLADFFGIIVPDPA